MATSTTPQPDAADPPENPPRAWTLTFTKAKIFSEIRKQTPMFARFSVVAGERGAAGRRRARHPRNRAQVLYRGGQLGPGRQQYAGLLPPRSAALSRSQPRDQARSAHGMRSADNNWDFWTLLPDALHQVTITMSDRGIPKSLLQRRVCKPSVPRWEGVSARPA
jgi:catalase